MSSPSASLAPDPIASSPATGVVGACARAAADALSGRWYLAVLAGPDSGLVLPVPEDGVIGRGEILTDPAVSRRHLLLTTGPDDVTAADAGSANGTRAHRRVRWRPLRSRLRCREGTRFLMGSTVLELRRRPTDLTVPAPPAPSQQRKVRLAAGGATMALLVIALLAMRATGRGSYGMLAMAPMVLMALARLGPLAPRRRHRHRRRSGTGWNGRVPDPPSMLLALAVRPTDQSAQSGGPQEDSRTAWLSHRRRRDVFELRPGQCTALTGEGAPEAVRWWSSQIVARGQARISPVENGFRLAWGRDPGGCSAELLAAPGTPPGRARTVHRAPPDAPHVSKRWCATVDQLIAPPESSASSGAPLPDRVRLEEVVGRIDRDGIAARWRSHLGRGTGDCLPAVLGVHNGLPVTADLVSDGPHALMAGTTGSGKSELLTSWLLQLVLALPPSRLALVLVDYKGGAAFGPLDHLPHTAGVLTDLDPAGTGRALASLEAEVRRREHLLATVGAKDVTAMDPEQAPPRLVVAVDEFATLATQHPDILDSLVRVAAQGRSLGIHLILATQRPAGAVSPAIRANTTLRVCLRVLDAGDSRDVLGHDGAASLDARPGRVLIEGTDCRLNGPAQAPWCGPAPHLMALIDEVRAAAEASATEPASPWRPWAPPLPTSPSPEEAVALGPAAAPGDGLVLAATDHPQEQRLGHWRWSVDRPMVILGSPGSGRTTTAIHVASAALESGLAVSMCLNGSLPDQLAPAVGKGLGTVVGTEDPRRLARLWSLASCGELGGELLVIDDADAMTAAVDEVLGPGEGQNLLEILARTAPATRTGLMLTAPLTMANARWVCRIGLHIVLGAPQPAQAAVAGLPRGVVTGSGPGRGVIVDGAVEAHQALAAQLVLPRAPRSARARPTHRLSAIPRVVAPGRGRWAVGGDDARPLPVPDRSVLVVGPPGSGRTTALRGLERCRREVIESQEALVVDDLDQADSQTQARVEQAMQAGRPILASATTDRTAGTYRGPLAALRERGDLVVLWPALGPASQVAGRSLRPVTDPRAPTLPGRGVLISRAGAFPLQIAADGDESHTL